MALDQSCDDDLFLLAFVNDEMELDHHDPNNPISDLNYAHGLNFQEALMDYNINIYIYI